MGGIVTRERRQQEPVRRKVSQTRAVDPAPSASFHKAASTKETLKQDPPTPVQTRRAAEREQGLTEDMIEGLTRSSDGSELNKDRKKETLNLWLLNANYVVTTDNDALERHRESMIALAKTLLAKKESGLRSRNDQRRSSSRGSRSKPGPEVKVYAAAAA